MFAALEGMEYPELHDDAIPVITFVKALTKLMLMSGVHDFTLKDLYKPDYQRTRRNISAIINFGKYREEKLALFTELSERTEGAAQRRSFLQEENARLVSGTAAALATGLPKEHHKLLSVALGPAEGGAGPPPRGACCGGA